MKRVPFYANHEDGMRCMLAVYRSIFDYFVHRKMSWEELDAFTGYRPGQAAWTLKSLVHFAAMGFDVRMIEPFDYVRYSREGKAYFEELYPPHEVEWYYKNSNISEITPQIPEFLENVGYECRQPQLKDIDDMLHDGRLVFVSVNSRVLNDREGFVSHAILVHDKEGDEYVFHDPGGKTVGPQADRRIGSAKLWQAMGGDDNTAEVTGFKLKARRNLRLDQYVISQYPSLSRAYAVRMVDEGKVTVNGKPAKPGYKLRETDTVSIDYDEDAVLQIPDIELPILYEDDDCIVINKPAGVLTHSVGKLSGEATVASFLRSKLHGQPAIADPKIGIRNNAVNQANLRAGIVHRLDRVTSGVIICAKHPEALAWLQKQFHDRNAKKTYSAIVSGQPDPPEAVIDMPIERNPKAPATFRVGANGKSAVTWYRTEKSNGKFSLLELQPQTGRTHQLRVHMAQRKHPIVGDFMYGGKKADRLFLHAHKLEIIIPSGETKTFTAPIPKEFTTFIG